MSCKQVAFMQNSIYLSPHGQSSISTIVNILCPSSLSAPSNYATFQSFHHNNYANWNQTWQKCYLVFSLFYMICISLRKFKMAARPFMLSEIKENNLESDCVMDLLHGRNAPYITLRKVFSQQEKILWENILKIILFWIH